MQKRQVNDAPFGRRNYFPPLQSKFPHRGKGDKKTQGNRFAASEVFLSDNKKADFGSIATIILFPFISWLTEQCAKREINNLYFIARDGYIIKEIFDIVSSKLNLNIKSNYIYGSRFAWRLSCAETMEDLKIAFTQFRATKTIKTLADLLQITCEELFSFLPKIYKDPDKKILGADIALIYNFLNKDEKFIDFIKEKNKEKRELLKKYLKQNMDFSNDKFAFVDLTGTGITLDLLGKLIEQEFNVKPKAFYYRFAHNWDLKHCEFYSYIQRNTSYLVEYLCRAPHGQTIGFYEENQKVLPILDKCTIDNFEKYFEAVKTCAHFLTNSFHSNKLDNSINLSYSYLCAFKDTPSKDIVNYFTEIPFSNFTGAQETKKKNISVKELIEHHYTKDKPISGLDEGTDYLIQNSSPMVKILAKFFKTFPKFNKRYFKKIKRQTSMILKHEFFY